MALVGAAIALWPDDVPEPSVAAVLPSQPPAPPPRPIAVDAAMPDGGAGAPVVESMAAVPVQAPPKAQRGTDIMISLLHRSKAFRPRARAAIVLGQRRSPRVTSALIRALKDKHPAVRRAATESLRRIGSPRALAALRRLQKSDKDPRVKRAAATALAKFNSTPAKVQPAVIQPSGPRYYVGVHAFSDPKGRLSAAQTKKLGAALRSRVAALRGVKLAPAGESSGAAKRVIAGGRAGFYVTASVTRLEFVPGTGIRAAATLMVGTYPGRNMRAIVKGSVTLSGSSDSPAAREAAMKAALSSAARKLPPAFARSRR